MKVRKTLTVIFLVCGLLTGWSLQAAAATFTCTVNSAGPSGTAETATAVRINLTEASSAWGPTQFSVTGARSKEFLAVALTAIANGQRVQITTPNHAAPSPRLTSIFLLSP